MSRSASRTRWMITCFAVWARMRPKSLVSSLTPMSSPSSAPGSRPRARSRSTWLVGSITCSTTSRNSKISISPSSSLKRASISRSWPNLRRAAWRIASSMAPITTCLSMPLSLAIWSISRLRPANASFMLVSPSSPGGAPGGAPRGRRAGEILGREVVHLVRLRHLGEGDAHLGAVHLHAQRLGVEVEELSLEAAASVLGTLRLDVHLAAARRGEVLLAPEHAVETRGGDLEAVAHGDRCVRAEVRAELPRNARAHLDPDAPVADRRVHDHPQDPRAPTLVQLHVHQLERVGLDHGLDPLAQLARDVPIHRPPPPPGLRSRIPSPEKKKADAMSASWSAGTRIQTAQARATYRNQREIATATHPGGKGDDSPPAVGESGKL